MRPSIFDSPTHWTRHSTFPFLDKILETYHTVIMQRNRQSVLSLNGLKKSLQICIVSTTLSRELLRCKGGSMSEITHICGYQKCTDHWVSGTGVGTPDLCPKM